jgi:hemoglobin/transferrin/lactoferrin receptor protein
MKKIILIALLCLGLTAYAQQVQITDERNNPLEMVELRSKQNKVSIFTDANGKADVSRLKSANDIQIILFGYRSKTLSYSEIERQNFKIQLNEDVFSQDEFVVSATRWKQSKRNVPNKITTISPKEVALLNPQTAADMLATSGEVFIQKSQQGGGSPMIRGFATNRLLYTVDGVRMNNAIFRGGNIQNVISLDPFAIENTEVFFGPGSVVYGSDAIGGVMAFQTLSPKLSKGDSLLMAANAVARHATANKELTGHGNFSIGNKNWASVTSFSYHNFGDLRMGERNTPEEFKRPFWVERINDEDVVVPNPDPFLQDPTGYDQFNIMQKISYQSDVNWSIDYGFHYSETSEYSRFDRLMELNNNGVPRSAVWNYGPQIWMMHNLRFDHKNVSGNGFYDDLNIRLAYQYFEESRIDRRFNHHRLRTQLEQVDAYSLNIDFEKELNSRNQFFYGLEGVRNDVRSQGTAVDIRDNSPMIVSNRYPQANWNGMSAYVNQQFLWTEKLRLQAGLRYNYFLIDADFSEHLALFPFDFADSRVQNDAINGSIGAVFTPNKNWFLSSNVSTGFRAPNVDDVGKIFDFQVGDVTVPNTNLGAEYAYNFEATASRIFGQKVKLDVTGFYTYLDDAIVRRTFQVAGQDSILYDGVMSQVFALQNAAFAEVYGFNVNLEWKIVKNLSLNSRFNYQFGIEEMEDGSQTRSRHAAPWFGVTRLTYATKLLDLQLYAMYSGAISAENLNEEERQKPFLYARDENGNPYSPSWYTLNFKVMYAVNKNFSVSAGIENITDEGYRTYSSGIAAAGRNFIVSFRGRF